MWFIKLIIPMVITPILVWLLNLYKPFFRAYRTSYMSGVIAAEKRYMFIGGVTDLKKTHCDRHLFGIHCRSYWEGYLDYINYIEGRLES